MEDRRPDVRGGLIVGQGVDEGGEEGVGDLGGYEVIVGSHDTACEVWILCGRGGLGRSGVVGLGQIVFGGLLLFGLLTIRH